MSVFTKLTLSEFKLTLRDPLYVFFTLLFPLLLITILGNVPTMQETPPELGGLRVIDVYAGAALGLAIGIIGLQGMPAVLATYRERGILRRFATTLRVKSFSPGCHMGYSSYLFSHWDSTLSRLP